VGFRRGKLIAGCYGSRTRMKTASARFFFWSASFHEEGGLVVWRNQGTRRVGSEMILTYEFYGGIH